MITERQFYGLPVTISKKLGKVSFSGIRKTVEIANNMEKSGEKIIRLNIGEPDFKTPKNIVEAAAKSLLNGNTRYGSNYGSDELRKAISKKLKNINNIEANPSNEIIVTVGAQEAIASSLMALIDPENEVIIGSPYYIPYKNIIEILEGVPVCIPLKEENNYCFDINELEKIVNPNTKVLILNNPNNPTGAVIPKKHLEELASFCHKHGIVVISDEAYDQLTYDDEKHISIASLEGMKERTVSIFSFSKTYAMTGWRIGYIASSPQLIDAIIRIHQNVVIGATAFAQEGAVEALEGDQSSLFNMKSEFKKRRDIFYNGLKEIGMECFDAKGGFYLFPSIKKFNMTSWEFFDYLAKYGVIVVPGVEFGEAGEGYIRISYALSTEECIEAMERIKTAILDLS